MRNFPYDRLALSAAFLIFAVTFVFDIFSPVPFTIWFPYLFPVLLIQFVPQHMIYLIPAAGTALIFFNFFHDPPPGVAGFAAVNRLLAVGLYWLIAFTVGQRNFVERALRESEYRYRSLFQSMEEGFSACEMIYDESGNPVDFRYLEANRAFARLTGLRHEEIAGRTLKQLFPGINDLWVQNYDRVLRTGRGEVFESAERVPGKIFDIHVWRTGSQRFAVIMADVTARKRAEEVLKRDRDTLDRLITERSWKLLEAQKELDRSRRLSDIGTLAAIVAHELRNPLALILLAASSIRKKSQDFEIGDKAETIEKKVEEGNKIIDDLLFYARLKPPHIESVDLYGLLMEGRDIVRARYPGRRIKLHLKADAVKGMSIEADPGQLKEVMGNLLNNAAEAIPSDRDGLIEVSAARVDGTVEVSVRDNGSGISAATREHLFQPFFSTKNKGTGLGLSIVKQIIDMHQGSIDVRSEQEKGTDLVLRLPIQRAKTTP